MPQKRESYTYPFIVAFLVILLSLLIQTKLQPIGFLHANFILPTLVAVSFFLGILEIATLSLFVVFYLNYQPFLGFPMIFLFFIPFLSFWGRKIFPAKMWLIGFLVSFLGILVLNVGGGFASFSQNSLEVGLEFLGSLVYGALVFWGFYRFFEGD